MHRVLTLALLLPYPLLAGADTYKCRDAGGRLTYTDRPCAGSQVQPYKPPRTVTVPPLPKVDVSGLPRDEQGRPILSRSGGAALVLEKQERPSPLNVLAACGVLVSHCFKPGERDLDECFHSAPRCASARPWEDVPYQPCCPDSCRQLYETRRREGLSPLAAFDQALYGGEHGRGGCIPVR